MKPVLLFSVLLLRPDTIANQYGEDTYFTFVGANDPVDAVRKARIEACQFDEGITEPEDYFVLLVIAGAHTDINPEQ